METRPNSDIDVEILKKVLQRNADMWKTAQLVARASSRARYPLASYDDLLCLADAGKQSCTVDGDEIDLEKARSYFPCRFFPVEDEDDLIGKLLIAFSIGRRCHDLEAELRHVRKEVANVDDAE